MKPYTIESYKAGKKPMTRNRKTITQFAFFEYAKEPFVYTVEGDSFLFTCHTDGRYKDDSGESGWDLFEAPVKREGWINIYGVDDARNPSHTIHGTEQKAREGGSTNENYITSIKIEWEE